MNKSLNIVLFMCGLAVLVLLASCVAQRLRDDKHPQVRIKASPAVENSGRTDSNTWGPVTQENAHAVRTVRTSREAPHAVFVAILDELAEAGYAKASEPIDLAGFQGRIKVLQPLYPTGKPIWFRLEIKNTTDATKRLYWSSAYPYHVSFDVSGGGRFVTGRAIPGAHTEMKLTRYSHRGMELPVERGIILIPPGRVQAFEIVLSSGLGEGSHVLHFRYQLNPTGGADGAMGNFSCVDIPPVTVLVRQ